jgi:hypothetical protein
MSLCATKARLLDCDSTHSTKEHLMNASKYWALAAASCALLAVVYAARPNYDKLATDNRALATELKASAPIAYDSLRVNSCFDEVLRAISCNDALIAAAATGRATP